MTYSGLPERIRESQRAVRKSLRAISTVSSDSAPIIQGLPDVLKAVLASLRQTTTSLALSFKPPITTAAALAQLDKLVDQVGRVVSCVLAASGLVALEWQEGAQAIAAAIDGLLDVLAAAAETGASSSEENPYLVHTGMVWDAIEKLAGLSASESEAALKRCKAHGEMIKDAWTEFKDVLENDDEDDDADTAEHRDDDSDDGSAAEEEDEWGQLERGLLGFGKMSAGERTRAQAAKPLLGLHQILHATIPRYIPSLPPTDLRLLVDASSGFVTAFDEAVSCMYPEQNEDEICEAFTKLSGQALVVVAMLQGAGSGPETFLDKWKDRLEKEIALCEFRTSGDGERGQDGRDGGLSFAKLSL